MRIKCCLVALFLFCILSISGVAASISDQCDTLDMIREEVQYHGLVCKPYGSASPPSTGLAIADPEKEFGVIYYSVTDPTDIKVFIYSEMGNFATTGTDGITRMGSSSLPLDKITPIEVLFDPMDSGAYMKTPSGYSRLSSKDYDTSFRPVQTEPDPANLVPLGLSLAYSNDGNTFTDLPFTFALESEPDPGYSEVYTATPPQDARWVRLKWNQIYQIPDDNSNTFVSSVLNSYLTQVSIQQKDPEPPLPPEAKPEEEPKPKPNKPKPDPPVRNPSKTKPAASTKESSKKESASSKASGNQNTTYNESTSSTTDDSTTSTVTNTYTTTNNITNYYYSMPADEQEEKAKAKEKAKKKEKTNPHKENSSTITSAAEAAAEKEKKEEEKEEETSEKIAFFLEPNKLLCLLFGGGGGIGAYLSKQNKMF